jgi:hypothetical protein
MGQGWRKGGYQMIITGFALKIALNQCDFRFFTLSIICDERRRHRRGAPAAD